jgi:hypothetical protein
MKRRRRRKRKKRKMVVLPFVAEVNGNHFLRYAIFGNAPKSVPINSLDNLFHHPVLRR